MFYSSKMLWLEVQIIMSDDFNMYVRKYKQKYRVIQHLYLNNLIRFKWKYRFIKQNTGRIIVLTGVFVIQVNYTLITLQK